MEHKKSRTLVCKFCQKIYETRSSRSRYCSTNCAENGRKRIRAYDIPRRMKDLANSAKYRAKPKGVAYDIDGDFLLDLWEKQNGCCAVTKVPFDLSYSETLQTGWSKKHAPSLDRIVPRLGYTKGNVRLVAFQVNCAMGVYTDEDFYEMCELALKNKNRN